MTIAAQYPETNTYNPIKNSTFTPSVDILSKRKKINGTLKDGSPKVLNYYSKTDIMVYGALSRSIRESNNLFPQIKTIAERAHCHYGSAQRSLAKFEKDLVIFSRETGRAKNYYFVPLNDDGTPDENSGVYQTAKALQSSKKLDLIKQKARSDLAKSYISNKEQDSIPLESVKKVRERPFEPPPKIPKSGPQKQELATANCIKKIRQNFKQYENKSIGNAIIKRGLNQYGEDYMLWLANESKCKPNPVRYFCKGINKGDTYEKYNKKISRECEAAEIAKQQQASDGMNNIADQLSAIMKAAGNSDQDKPKLKQVTFNQAKSEFLEMFANYKDKPDNEIKYSNSFKAYCNGAKIELI